MDQNGTEHGALDTHEAVWRHEAIGGRRRQQYRLRPGVTFSFGLSHWGRGQGSGWAFAERCFKQHWVFAIFGEAEITGKTQASPFELGVRAWVRVWWYTFEFCMGLAVSLQRLPFSTKA